MSDKKVEWPVFDNNIIWVEKYNDMVDDLIRDYVARENPQDLREIKNLVDLIKICRKSANLGEEIQDREKKLTDLKDQLVEFNQQLRRDMKIPGLTVFESKENVLE